MFIKNPTEGFRPKKPSDNKSKSRTHSYKTGHRLPILSAEELLSSKKRHWILEQLRQLSNLDEESHKVTYADLIDRFARFVQLTPLLPTAHLGSLLNESLVRGFSSLYHHLHQPESQSLKKSAPNPMLLYAIFSAGLLVKVSRAATNQRVILTAEDGSFLKTWNPLSSSLEELGKFYKLRFVNDLYPGVHYALTVLLARQLMPAVAFEWLSSDEPLFSEWLNALHGTEKLDGRIAAALDASDEVHKTQEELLQELASEFADIEQVNCEETKQGEAFYQWLTNSLEAKTIEVNTPNAGIHVLPEGVFIDTKMVNQFKDQFKEIYGAAEISPTIVMAQFGNLMGIAEKGANDWSHKQYFSASDESRGATVSAGSPLSAISGVTARTNRTRMGFVLGDPRLIFSHGGLPGVSPYVRSALGGNATPSLPNLINKNSTSLKPNPNQK